MIHKSKSVPTFALFKKTKCAPVTDKIKKSPSIFTRVHHLLFEKTRPKSEEIDSVSSFAPTTSSPSASSAYTTEPRVSEKPLILKWRENSFEKAFSKKSTPIKSLQKMLFKLEHTVDDSGIYVSNNRLQMKPLEPIGLGPESFIY